MSDIVVIGGTSGIGQAIIRRFMRERDPEVRVLFTYNTGEAAAQAICADYGDRCRSRRLDLTSLDAVEAFLQALTAPPKVLVNCAGALRDGLVLGDIRERLTEVTTVNYLAPAMISAHVAKAMAATRQGHIVNITSTSARRARAGNAIYGSTKAALERFTATLALEMARFKVRTLCVAPAFVETPMFRSFAGDEPEKFIRDHVPMREILSPEDIASVVVGFVDGVIKTTGTTMTLANGEIVF